MVSNDARTLVRVDMLPSAHRAGFGVDQPPPRCEVVPDLTFETLVAA